ncbi:hypothetical protein [Roseateles asaccharophilus]|uniref:Uncharacterized protein n=1 Tax=Roseateles asaccharophilus TaxID=582607 RepID=A0ABU2A476_9BURK|nr:hypothetical protein [Roseateles asaccharophilus]MDR7331997.1 hypothetical protein [Roseateles asaccharophilus]
MTTHIAQQISKAFQATPAWTQDTPGDAASGTAAAAWSPVTAELARLAPATAPRADRLAAYTQLVAELRRARDQVTTSKKLGPAERIAFGNWVQLLLNTYETLLANT